jgi:DNA-binding MarR family transcriptional regulator
LLLAMDRTTLTAALKPLERRGLVRRAANANDRRTRLLTLTPDGQSLLKQALPVWERTHAALDQLLAGQESADLRGMLRALG